MKKILFPILILLFITAAAAAQAPGETIFLGPAEEPYGSAYPTPMSNPGQQYQSQTVTRSNWPYYARPVYPSGTPTRWTYPTSRNHTEIYVGDHGQYRTINEAVQHIPNNAGEVVIRLVSDTEEPQAGISVPLGKNITVFRITSNDDRTPRTIYPKDRSVWFFCNGIPLVVDQSVEFGKPSMIMGGTITYSGHSVSVQKSTIIINGKAYWVYAGGQSDRDDQSSTVDEALVIINGTVDRVYAGGRAIKGATVVNKATVVVNGTANAIYCSGYTENYTATSTVGRADMQIYGRYSDFGLGLGNGELYLLDPRGCYEY